MKWRLEIERETDGRWIAEVRGLPGVLVYGDTQGEALNKAIAFALRVVSEKIDHGEIER